MTQTWKVYFLIPYEVRLKRGPTDPLVLQSESLGLTTSPLVFDLYPVRFRVPVDGHIRSRGTLPRDHYPVF